VSLSTSLRSRRVRDQGKSVLYARVRVTSENKELDRLEEAKEDIERLEREVVVGEDQEEDEDREEFAF